MITFPSTSVSALSLLAVLLHQAHKRFFAQLLLQILVDALVRWLWWLFPAHRLFLLFRLFAAFLVLLRFAFFLAFLHVGAVRCSRLVTFTILLLAFLLFHRLFAVIAAVGRFSFACFSLWILFAQFRLLWMLVVAAIAAAVFAFLLIVDRHDRCSLLGNFQFLHLLWLLQCITFGWLEERRWSAWVVAAARYWMRSCLLWRLFVVVDTFDALLHLFGGLLRWNISAALSLMVVNFTRCWCCGFSVVTAAVIFVVTIIIPTGTRVAFGILSSVLRRWTMSIVVGSRWWTSGRSGVATQRWAFAGTANELCQYNTKRIFEEFKVQLTVSSELLAICFFYGPSEILSDSWNDQNIVISSSSFHLVTPTHLLFDGELEFLLLDVDRRFWRSLARWFLSRTFVSSSDSVSESFFERYWRFFCASRAIRSSSCSDDDDELGEELRWTFLGGDWLRDGERLL